MFYFSHPATSLADIRKVFVILNFLITKYSDQLKSSRETLFNLYKLYEVEFDFKIALKLFKFYFILF